MMSFLLAGGSFNPIKLDNWSLYFWTVIVFVLLLLLLMKFVWRPLMNAVDARESKIREDLEKAEQGRKEAEELREKHRVEMESAAQQAKASLDEARERAETLRTELETKAREEAQGIVERARQQIDAEKEQALREIKDQVVDLSVAITQRIIENAPGRDDHAREADALIARMKDLN